MQGCDKRIGKSVLVAEICNRQLDAERHARTRDGDKFHNSDSQTTQTEWRLRNCRARLYAAEKAEVNAIDSSQHPRRLKKIAALAVNHNPQNTSLDCRTQASNCDGLGWLLWL